MSLHWLTIAQIEQGVIRLNFSAFGNLPVAIIPLTKSAIALQRPTGRQTGACGLPPAFIRQNDGIFAKPIN